MGAITATPEYHSKEPAPVTGREILAGGTALTSRQRARLPGEALIHGSGPRVHGLGANGGLIYAGASATAPCDEHLTCLGSVQRTP